MHILLAEDDALLADGLAAQLRGAGFVVEHAPNGAVAEYLLGKQHFDLAILDIGLPLSDGFTVLRRLREAKVAIPVIILTARDSVTDTVAGLEGGADDYIAKPIDVDRLVSLCRVWVRK